MLLLSSCSGKWFLTEENDYFSLGKNSDRNYSQGLQVGTNIQDDTGYHTYYGQQRFYTPAHKKISEPQPDERPYSGYLALGYKKVIEVEDEQWVRGIELGVVGPLALGREIQNGVHSLLDQNRAQGWDNQLGNEPVVIATLEKKKAYRWMSTVIGGNLGNAFTQAYVGTLVHYPFVRLNSDPIFPRVKREETKEFSYHLFAGPTGRWVIRNIFLDGNTFEDSASIDKYPFVLEGRIGFALEYDGYRFSYQFIRQTAEYKGEGSGAGFGSVTLGWGF